MSSSDKSLPLPSMPSSTPIVRKSLNKISSNMTNNNNNDSNDSNPPSNNNNNNPNAISALFPYFFDRTPASELQVGLRDGTKIALKMWGDERASIKILALHGWLDNASTWDTLAPLLVGSRLRIRFVAMDLPGHGQSSHKPLSGHYTTADYALAVVGTADALNWGKFHLFAHSMGATIAPVVAAACPQRIESLTLFDGIAPFHFTHEYTLEGLRTAVSEHSKILNRQRRVYPSLSAALERHRKQNPDMLPESSDILTLRSTEEVLVTGEGEKSEKGFVFTHDPRLVGRSAMTYGKDFVYFMLSKIECPTLVVVADRQKPIKPMVEEFIRRTQLIPKGKHVMIAGEHHVHLDHPDRVFKPVMDHLLSILPEDLSIPPELSKSSKL